MSAVLPTFSAIPAPPTKDEQVYERLRRAIVEGEVAPGQELPVASVAVQLGVSRIPVMRACQRLVGEGFLETNARRAMVVVPLTEERVTEEFSLLNDLECMAVREAVRHATSATLKRWQRLNDALAKAIGGPRTARVEANLRFHAALWDSLQSPYVRNLVGLVWDHLEPARNAASQAGPWDHNLSTREHQAVIDAVARRDAPAAEAAVRRHRQQTVDRVLAFLHSRPHPAAGA
jgi:DNA-binding GntR family transcriptional regulator